MDLYFDCASGISGDMTLGALIDLGVPVTHLREHLQPLLGSHFTVDVEPCIRCGMGAKRVFIRDLAAPVHRTFADISNLIQSSALSANVKERAIRIFHRIAAAEGEAHGVPLDDVHFHEVGAVDSIADIVGASLGFEFLGVLDIWSGPLPSGSGWTRCEHGPLPIPVPAVCAILAKRGAVMVHDPTPLELVTPTGAAIACEAKEFGHFPTSRVLNVGIGAGSRDPGDRPNVLRILALEGSSTQRSLAGDTVCCLTTNLDNATPELLGHALERIFQAGALDATYEPLWMKKGRPGHKLEVLCAPELAGPIADLIFAELPTLGIRHQELQRWVLPRAWSILETPWGPLNCKGSKLGDKVRWQPEFESARSLAAASGIALSTIYIWASQEGTRKLKWPKDP